MYFDSSYILLIVVTLAIGLGSQAWVKSALSKYQNVPIASGLTGAQAAKQMLSYYGVDIPVQMGQEGQDFFDPSTNSITLSPSAFNTSNITSLATACHECGHACQYATGYSMMKFRTALVPVVNLCSNAWIIVFMIGIFLNLAGFAWLAIGLYAATVLFALVTLPVEFDASSRAIKYMKTINIDQSEVKGSEKVLRACAFTYVAAMLASLLQLFYLIGQAQRR